MNIVLTSKGKLFIFCLLFWPLWSVPLVAAEEGFRVGRAAVKITPPAGAPMGSSYGIRISKGVEDDLYAKALVLEHRGGRAALVALDLISLRPPIVAKARGLIQDLTGIPSDRVILTATHCHTGPQMHPLFLGLLEEEPRKIGLQYVEKLPGLIAESVRQAVDDLRPARVSAGISHEDSISFNRRFLMKDGSVKMNPGRNNPEAVRAMGPIDPRVSVTYFESLEGEPLATLVNYSLHVAVAGGERFSSDFPGVLARQLSRVKGPEMLTIFTNGTSGNVNHIDVNWDSQPRGHAEAARIGTILAAKVLEMYSSLKPVREVPLGAKSVPVRLAVPEVTSDQIRWARKTISNYGQPHSPPFHDVVRAWRIIDLEQLNGKLETEIQAITLGDQLALVGFPGDAFVELGLSIKTNSPFPFTLVSEQAGSGAISYVPNLKAFSEGGYEVISARFSPGGGEQLVDAAVQVLIDLFPHDWVRQQEPARH